jgi:hypothetical protein
LLGFSGREMEDVELCLQALEVEEERWFDAE